jgi:hypothetical protein
MQSSTSNSDGSECFATFLQQTTGVTADACSDFVDAAVACTRGLVHTEFFRYVCPTATMLLLAKSELQNCTVYTLQ